MTPSVQFVDEASVWAAFQAGDRQAFEQLYRAHAGPLLTYGKRLSNDADHVADVVQDVFLEIWQRRATLTRPSTVRFYLFRIVRNRLVGAIPRSRDPLLRSDELTQADHLLITPSIEALVTEAETEQDTQARLKQAIEQLPPRQREVITLAFYHQLGNDEIAQLMAINVQSVINHLSRAFAALRSLLANTLWLLLAGFGLTSVKIFRIF